MMFAKRAGDLLLVFVMLLCTRQLAHAQDVTVTPPSVGCALGCRRLTVTTGVCGELVEASASHGALRWSGAERDCFVDTDDHTRSAKAAYELLHKRSEPRHLRAFAQEITYLTIGTTWYWLAYEQNLVDWDRPSAKARFSLDVIRLDNNSFPINFTLHPWSGAAYYSAARTNGLSWWASAGYALGSSLAWEYGIEFREKVSFNDLIATPLPAITLGEFFSHLMLYVNRPAAEPTRLQRAVGWLFGPLQALSDVFEGERKYADAPADNLGFSAHQHHAFRAHLGVALQNARERTSVLSELGFDGSFTAIPSYGRPGRFSRFLYDADLSRFWMTFTQSGGQREFDSYADLSLFGLYEQRIDRDLHGGSIFLGSSLGYRYRRSFLKGFRDDVSATHLPGFALEALALFGPRYTLRISYRLHPDFAGVRALAADDWQSANPDERGKSVVEKKGYLYAFGVTNLLEASLSAYRVQVGGRVWFAYYNSKEGLDRTQEELTADPKGVDYVLDGEGYVRVWPLENSGFMLELAGLGRHRISRLGGYEQRADMMRFSLRTGFTF